MEISSRSFDNSLKDGSVLRIHRERDRLTGKHVAGFFVWMFFFLNICVKVLGSNLEDLTYGGQESLSSLSVYIDA